MQAILLDGKIRDWVLVPIFLICLMVEMGRYFAIRLLTDRRVGVDENNKNKNILVRAERLRKNGFILTRAKFNWKRAIFRNLEIPEVDPTLAQKGSSNVFNTLVVSEFPKLVMTAIVSYFFTGFVVCQGEYAYIR